MKKVIVITGPTGVGKTKLSVMLAKYLNTEIINSDAYQIYQDMMRVLNMQDPYIQAQWRQFSPLCFQP